MTQQGSLVAPHQRLEGVGLARQVPLEQGGLGEVVDHVESFRAWNGGLDRVLGKPDGNVGVTNATASPPGTLVPGLESRLARRRAAKRPTRTPRRRSGPGFGRPCWAE